MESYQNKQYKNSIARNIVTQVQKNGIFLDTNEALKMANQLEEADRVINHIDTIDRQADSLRNSILKAFEQLQNGKPLDEVMNEFGIFPNDGYAINGFASLKCGTYYKGNITRHSNGSSFGITEYACPSDKQFDRDKL